MNAPHPAIEAWSAWGRQIESLKTSLRRVKGTLVSSRALQSEAKEAVQSYFREVRPRLVSLGSDEVKIDEFDSIMQGVLRLASGANRKTTYQKRIKELQHLRGDSEIAIEIRASGTGAQAPTSLMSATEMAIYTTLDQMVPSMALSYKQVLQDLAEPQRVSYRGTAAELREVLRELLDHFAPDAEVLKTIKLDKEQRRPSMKQKATFILKARGVGDTTRKTAEDAVAAVEGSIASLARSVYDRGSVSTHVATTRAEVLTFKGYTDAVLAELLQVHK